MSATIKSSANRTFDVLTVLITIKAERSDGYEKQADTLCSCLPDDFPRRL